MPKRKYQSNILAAIHEHAQDLHDAGVMDKITMRQFDAMAFEPPPVITSVKIREVREANHVSQAVFAKCLNTSVSTVQKWETGAKAPSGPAARLLDIVERKGLQILLD